jgi:dephospho-CoA kinase
MTFVVGLTGGIGSGKSAAADAFARLGAGVVDTDAIAHELTGPGGPAMAEIERIFGPEFVSASNALNRERMRELVFREPAQKRRLEGLLHPMIRAESERRIRASSAPYVVHVVPLLVESPGYRERAGRVLVVDCPEPLQAERVRARSGLSPEQVAAVIKSQVSREKRLAAADDVIDNSGSIDALQQQVKKLHEKYLSLAAQSG